jgi:hypothetical protein
VSARWFRGFFGVWTVGVHGTLRAAGKLRGTRTTVFSRHAVLFLYNASTLIFGLVPPHQKISKSLGDAFFFKT